MRKMTRILLTLISLLAILVIGGCMNDISKEVNVQNSKRATSSTSFGTNYANVYYRGSSNAWGLTKMTLSENFTRVITLDLNSDTESFRIDTTGTWGPSYPAQNYVISPARGKFTISFYENTKVILVSKVTTPDKGTVNVLVFSDSVKDGKLVSDLMSGAGVYLNDWHAGNLLATTSADGRATFDSLPGDIELSLFKATSSHSYATGYGYKVKVEAGKTSSLMIHMAPTQVSITANYQTAYGKALYLTGDTSYLGSWTTGYKLNYDNTSRTWSYNGNLPLGAQYKVVLADWTTASSITIGSSVKWEQGNNHVISNPSGYYESVNNISPKF